MAIGRVPGETGIQPSIVTAKGDLIVATANGSVTNQAVGTNNQVLMADSTQADGVKWANEATSTLTTTGDILYASAANTLARRAIGSTGDVLTVSGGLPTWAAPASAATNYSLLNAGGTALTGAATITVSGISNQDKLFIYVSLASSVNAAAFSVRFNGDTGSNYYDFGFEINRTATAPNWARRGPTAQTAIRFASNNNTTDEAVMGMIVAGCKSSGIKVFDIKGATTDNNGCVAYNTNGFYNSSSTISSVSIVSESGNFDGGTVFVYGSNN